MRASWLGVPWRTFLSEHHGKRPAVFRGVVRAPFVSPREALEAVAAARPPGDSPSADPFAAPTLRIYDRGEPIEIDDEIRPRRSDRSVAGYVRRLETRLAEPAVVVNSFQAGSPRVFLRALEVLVPLYQRIGLPTGGAMLDLFAGTYRRSPLGVHKDEQDVFTFVLHGRKRFLVWPFEALAHHKKTAQRHAPDTLTGAHPDALRAGATVLEAGPGDLVYWPASAWHFAEGDGDLVVTLGLGVFPRTNPLFLLERAARQVALDARLSIDADAFPYDADAFPYDGDATGARRAMLRRVLSSPEARDAEEAAFEAWRSAFGFARVPRPLPDLELGPDEVVRVIAPEALRWTDQRRLLVVFAGGHLLRVPRHPSFVALLALLRGGRPHRVRALARSCEPDIAADAVEYLLAFLVQSHVLARVTS